MRETEELNRRKWELSYQMGAGMVWRSSGCVRAYVCIENAIWG